MYQSRNTVHVNANPYVSLSLTYNKLVQHRHAQIIVLFSSTYIYYGTVYITHEVQ